MFLRARRVLFFHGAEDWSFFNDGAVGVAGRDVVDVDALASTTDTEPYVQKALTGALAPSGKGRQNRTGKRARGSTRSARSRTERLASHSQRRVRVRSWPLALSIGFKASKGKRRRRPLPCGSRGRIGSRSAHQLDRGARIVHELHPFRVVVLLANVGLVACLLRRKQLFYVGELRLTRSYEWSGRRGA